MATPSPRIEIPRRTRPLCHHFSRIAAVRRKRLLRVAPAACKRATGWPLAAVDAYTRSHSSLKFPAAFCVVVMQLPDRQACSAVNADNHELVCPPAESKERRVVPNRPAFRAPCVAGGGLPPTTPGAYAFLLPAQYHLTACVAFPVLAVYAAAADTAIHCLTRPLVRHRRNLPAPAIQHHSNGCGLPCIRSRNRAVRRSRLHTVPCIP